MRSRTTPRRPPWAGAIISGATGSSVVHGGAEVIVAASMLVLAWGMAGTGRWMAAAEA